MASRLCVSGKLTKNGQGKEIGRDHQGKAAQSALSPQQPIVDLEIYFDAGSAAIKLAAVPQLADLGKTLATPELKESLLIISGHTDGKASNSSNQKLSERRAEAISSILLTTFICRPSYGMSKLKNEGDPYPSENRRVEILLTAQTKTQQ
jgi:outer membrane protein OmpA-like peptidoglycan-associated protein